MNRWIQLSFIDWALSPESHCDIRAVFSWVDAFYPHVDFGVRFPPNTNFPF